MNPLHDPHPARNETLALTIAAVVLAGWLALKARRARRRAAEGSTMPPRPARSTSTAFWLLIVGAGVAAGWAMSGERPGAAVLGALVVMIVLVPVLGAAWIVGAVAWHVAASRLAYRVANRAYRRATRGDLDGAIAELGASVDRRRRPATDPADAWAPPPSAVARDPRLAADLATLGGLERLRGDWAAAADHFRAAEAVAEGFEAAQVRAARADALIRLGRPDEGIALMRAAVEQFPPDEAANRSQLGLRLATALIALGRLDEVDAILDAAAADWGRTVILGPPRFKKAGFAAIAAARDQLAAARAGRDVGHDGPSPTPAPSPEAPRRAPDLAERIPGEIRQKGD